MRKLFIFAFITTLNITSGFSQARVLSPEIAGKTKGQKADKAEGSMYTQKAFAAAKVSSIEGKSFMRYNTFSDEFEFITPKNDTLILDKIEDFKEVMFIGSNKKFVLTPYTNNKNRLTYGYLIQLYEKGNYGLFKKENISFIEAKTAKTTLEMSMPAKYNKSEDTYFLKNKDAGISEFPDSKKDLIKLFPDKKQSIETFVKEQKISFDKEADMIKIVDFLAAQ